MSLRGHRRADGLVTLDGCSGLRLLDCSGTERESAPDGRVVLFGVHQDRAQRRDALRVRGPAQAVFATLVLHECLRVHERGEIRV